jgi:hypothetical protein
MENDKEDSNYIKILLNPEKYNGYNYEICLWGSLDKRKVDGRQSRGRESRGKGQAKLQAREVDSEVSAPTVSVNDFQQPWGVKANPCKETKMQNSDFSAPQQVSHLLADT